jgi:murein DD-endopeptidase MepM/ murein hydrolase activator NlpD
MIHLSRRHTYIILLVVVSVVAWAFAIAQFRKHQAEIVVHLADGFAAVALPYRVARLTLQDPDTQLLIPVYGIRPQDVADTWGDLRSEGRTHEGVDIFAKRGTPVFSATRGYVIRAGVNELGGNIVFIVGPGGVRYYYAHLDSTAAGIRTGKEVTTDTVIGFVGNTGNASSTPPHLHFGMYKDGAQNPYDLLTER